MVIIIAVIKNLSKVMRYFVQFDAMYRTVVPFLSNAIMQSTLFAGNEHGFEVEFVLIY